MLLLLQDSSKNSKNEKVLSNTNTLFRKHVNIDNKSRSLQADSNSKPIQMNFNAIRDKAIAAKILDAEAPPITDEQWKWIASFSTKYSNMNEDGSIINTSKHGSGHSDSNVTPSVAAFILLSMVLLILSTLYMLVRVYKQNKQFHKDWIKEYGGGQGQHTDPASMNRANQYKKDMEKEVD